MRDSSISGPILSYSLTNSSRALETPRTAATLRRFSTVHEYYNHSPRDWLTQESRFLKLEAIYKRKSKIIQRVSCFFDMRPYCSVIVS